MKSDYCHRGHPFDKVDAKGYRRCSECQRMAAARRRGGLPPNPVSLIDRLMAKVVIDTNGCWIYGGAISSGGYGSIAANPDVRGTKARMLKTHRVTYEHHVGPIADGLEPDHLCRVRACCNPQHLEPVTRRENVIRGVSPVAKNALATECLRGHAFSEENTYVMPTGGRVCKECRRAADAARRPRHRSLKAVA